MHAAVTARGHRHPIPLSGVAQVEGSGLICVTVDRFRQGSSIRVDVLEQKLADLVGLL